MKKVLFVATIVLLTASVAVAGNYTVQSRTGVFRDVTTLTNTVNAWKYFPGNPVCTPGSLTAGTAHNAVWCMGANGGPPYNFDFSKKTWTAHPEMGTAPQQLVVVNSSTVYSLQATSQCTNALGAGWYDLFKWNPSPGNWTQPNAGSCMTMASADGNGHLSVIGWDGIAHLKAIFNSTDGGKSYTEYNNGFVFARLNGAGAFGCAIGNQGGLWTFEPSDNTQFNSLPSLPAGTAAGCVYATDPVVIVAWNTAGQVYSMPLENYGSWQAVTGISAGTITGQSRFWLYGEDLTGKPYHWNLNAPGMSVVYGGQWNTQNGCPAPSTPCHTNATHTVKFQVVPKTGAKPGLGGLVETSTQLYTNNILVTATSYNPLCDPFIGLSGDVECTFVESGGATCNQSGEGVGSDGPTNYEVDDSIDVLEYSYNTSSSGPDRHQTVMYEGYYDGHIYNKVHDGCAVSDPLPACPVDTNVPLDIYLRVDWIGKLDQEAAAYSTWNSEAVTHRLGYSAPYVVHGWYLAQRLPGGSLVLLQCYGGWISEEDFLYGDIFNAPACK